MRFIKNLFNMFCYVTTLIFMFSSIYCVIFWGKDVMLSISYVWGTLGVAAATSLIAMIFSVDNEVSKVKIIIFRILGFVAISAIVFVCSHYLCWIDFHDKKMIFGMFVTVLIVYILVYVFEYFIGVQDAQQMNKVLKNRKEE